MYEGKPGTDNTRMGLATGATYYCYCCFGPSPKQQDTDLKPEAKEGSLLYFISNPLILPVGLSVTSQSTENFSKPVCSLTLPKPKYVMMSSILNFINRRYCLYAIVPLTKYFWENKISKWVFFFFFLHNEC